MREIVLDTETTGGSARQGDRVCELGMVEMVDRIPTGRVFHAYLNPEYPVHWAACRVHGLTNDMLANCPTFDVIGQEARDFIGDDVVLAHNSKFDGRFMNMEFRRIGLPEVKSWKDTVVMCRNALPGGSHKLDNLVERLGIVTPDRAVHGALLDAAILAAVVARISNAPEVDISGLVESGLHLPTQGKVLTSAKVTPSTKSGSARAERSRNLKSEARGMVEHIQDSYSKASDFKDFLSRVEAGGYRVRPNLAKSGLLSGFRFRSDNLYARGSDLGFRADHFQTGRIAYNPDEDLEYLNTLKTSYDQDFGPASDEKNDRYLVARFGEVQRVPLDRGDSSKAAHDTGPCHIQPDVVAMIAEINEETPRIDYKFYQDLRSGRDGISVLNVEEVIARIPEEALSSPAHEIISRMPDSSYKSCLRWMARGLSPEHTLCMSVSTDRIFNKSFPECMQEQAEDLIRDMSEAPDMDCSI